MNVMNVDNREKQMVKARSFMSPEKRGNDKFEAFLNIIKDPKGADTLKEKVRSLFLGEFEEKFQNILLEKTEDFLTNLASRVKLLIQDIYSEESLGEWQALAEDYLDTCFDLGLNSDIDINELILKEQDRLKKEDYLPNYKILSSCLSAYERKNSPRKNVSKNIEIPPYLKHFRKHCGSMIDAVHTCGEKIIEIKDENSSNPKVTHLLCVRCRKCFLPNCIHLFCTHCDVDYFSCIIETENVDLQPATWSKYHCGAIINDKMHCIKCKGIFYLNCKTGKLECVNQDCKFLVDPMKIQWTCMICKEEFKAEAKIYNPLEFKNIRSAIKECLLMKIKAKPHSVPCCSKVNLSIQSTVFYHKKECEGKVYSGELNGKKIVVCEKCKTMNFFEKYIWTCPACFKRFRIKGAHGNEDDCASPRKLNSDRNENTPVNKDYQRRNSQLAFYEKSADGNGVTPQKFDSRNSAAETKPRTKLSNTDLKSASKDPGIGMFKFSPDVRRRKNNDPISLNSCPFQLKAMNTGSTNVTNNNINVNLNISLKKSLIDDFNKAIIEEEEEKKIEKVNLNLINIININSNGSNLNHKRLPSKPPMPNIKLSDMKKMGKKLNLSAFPIENKLLEEEKIPNNPSRNSNNLSLAKTKSTTVSTQDQNKLLSINVDDYKLIKQVGEGSYGKIYLVEHKVTKECFALKKIIAHSKQEIDDFKNEYELMNTISANEYSSNFILKIFGVCVKELDKTTFALYVLMELADSDWEKEIMARSKNRAYYTEEALITMIKSIIKTLAEMQRENISHRDLKPQNILIFNQSRTKRPVYKIADFGEAKEMKLSKQAQQQNTLRGTELYMSPLLFISLRKENNKAVENNDYKSCKIAHNSFKSDVFSLGYCLFLAAALTFRSLYDIRELQDMHIIAQIVKKYLKDRYSSNFASLIIKMIDTNEKYRPDFIQLEQFIENAF